MKLAYTVSLIVAAWSQQAVAAPNAQDVPILKKRDIPARFHIKGQKTIGNFKTTTVEASNFTALYEIPDDLKNWSWWCSSDRSYCDESWGPTVSESNALADYLVGLGDQDCVIDRPTGSKEDGYTVLATIGSHAKAGMFFTHLGDTDRAYAASFPCLQVGYIMKSLIEACQCNGRIVGSTPIPNCWIKWMSYTGDQASPPGGGAAWPGAAVGIAPYP